MNGNAQDPMDPKLKELVQGSLPRVDTKLRRDLWPSVQARLGERRRVPGAGFRLRWWELALATGDLAAAYWAPEAIPALLYHL